MHAGRRAGGTGVACGYWAPAARPICTVLLIFCWRSADGCTRHLCLQLPGGEPIGYEAARELFRRDASQAWAAYVGGALVVLMREWGARFDGGLSILVSSGAWQAGHGVQRGGSPAGTRQRALPGLGVQGMHRPAPSAPRAVQAAAPCAAGSAIPPACLLEGNPSFAADPSSCCHASLPPFTAVCPRLLCVQTCPRARG